MSGRDITPGTDTGQPENMPAIRNSETKTKSTVSPEQLARIGLQMQLGFISLRSLAVVAEVSTHTIARWNLPGFKPSTKRTVFRIEDVRSFFSNGPTEPPETKRRKKRKGDQK